MARFYLDENVPPALASALHQYGHTATTTDEAERKGAPDHGQLWHTATIGAILLTGNAWDFYLLNDAWALWGVSRSHPGILAFPQLERGDVLAVAAAIDKLVRHPEETLALQALSGAVSPPANGDGTLTGRFYYRRTRDGRWTGIPPRPRR